MGEDIRGEHEIYEVARDVKARIEKLRNKMQAAAESVLISGSIIKDALSNI